jgi:hypothetical protein
MTSSAVPLPTPPRSAGSKRDLPSTPATIRTAASAPAAQTWTPADLFTNHDGRWLIFRLAV